MPTLVIPIDHCKAVYQFQRTGDTEIYETTIGVSLDVSYDIPTVLSQLALAWSGAGSLQDLTPANVTLVSVHAQFGTGPGNPPQVGDLPVTLAGSDSSGSLFPPQTAIVVKKRTATAGQRYRGRMFLPWCKEAQADDNGILSGAAIIGYNAALAVMLGLLDSASQLTGAVILHTDVGGGVSNDPTPITSLTVRSQVGTQRRRLRL